MNVDVDSSNFLNISRDEFEHRNLKGKNYNSVRGVEVDYEKGTFVLLLDETPAGEKGLISDTDIREVFIYGIDYCIFSVDLTDNLENRHFQKVLFSPTALSGSHYLKSNLHANYLLERISLGAEVSANYPHDIRDAQSGFMKNLPEHLQEKLKSVSERRDKGHKESVHHFWIKSGELEYKEDKLDKVVKFLFGRCDMEVKTHVKLNSKGELVDDSDEEEESDEEDSDDEDGTTFPRRKTASAETEFAKDFTECYDEVGCFFPVLLRLRELMKLSAVLKILKGIQRQHVDSKKGLREELSRKTRNMLDFMVDSLRDKTSYPRNTSTNVNETYQKLVSDQGIDESELSSAQKNHDKRELRKLLEKADSDTVDGITESLTSTHNLSHCSTLKKKVKEWLDGSSRGTCNLVEHITDEKLPTEYAKLDRKMKVFAEYCDNNWITLDRVESSDHMCSWVPATIRSPSGVRVYVGVCLNPKLKQVETFSKSGQPQGAGGGSSGRPETFLTASDIKLKTMREIVDTSMELGNTVRMRSESPDEPGEWRQYHYMYKYGVTVVTDDSGKVIITSGRGDLGCDRRDKTGEKLKAEEELMAK